MRGMQPRAGGGRWRGLLVAHVGLLLALFRPAAAAPGAPTVLLCVEDATTEAKPAAALERWLKGLRLVLVQGVCQRPAGARQLVARFERRPDAVDLVLRAPSGRTLRRHVPWISRTDGALARLAARGRLSELSVLLAALVTESGGAPRFRDAAQAPTPSSAPVAKRPAAATPTTTGQRWPRAVAPLPTPAAPADLQPRAGAPTADEPSAAARPAPEARQAAPAVGATARRGSAAARARFRPLRRQTAGRKVSAPPASVVRAAAPAPRSGRARWHAALRRFAVGVYSGARFRSSAVWSAELGGALRWRSLFVRAAYQLPAPWDLDGRRVEVSAVPLALGWQPRLWRGRALQLAGVVALVAEQTAVRRTDLPDARTHRFWDLGGALGAAALLRLPGSFELALSVEATVLPAARTVEVPAGPAAALSRFAVQSALTLWWGGRDG